MMSAAYFNYIYFCCHLHGLSVTPLACLLNGVDHRSLFKSADQHPYKKRRLSKPLETSEHDLGSWDLLWQTFWGKPATECFIKASTRIPDPRTLKLAKDETNY